MGRYAAEPDNATKAAKARGSNLRVHFKVKKGLFIISSIQSFKTLCFFWVEIHDLHIRKKKGIVLRS